ncbi:MAG TPA: P1 family peptidase [Terriglobales bacterium]|nr:P1 family peptidase [Terriglobales bacterium]
MKVDPRVLTLLTILCLACNVNAQQSAPKPRARDLAIPFRGTPGLLNAITDVPGVEVGFATLISGDGKLVEGQGPVRTGVTVIFPRGKESLDSVMAGIFNLNGNGEMTGANWVIEGGFLDGPIGITNTHSVGLVRDSIIKWQHDTHREPKNSMDGPYFLALPVVAETADVPLNDINGFHVRPDDVFAALNSATGGPVREGNVGGGTGMICFGWKGGTGTASRKLAAAGDYMVGVLVQANNGRPDRLTIAGVPIGDELRPTSVRPSTVPPGTGSIIVIVATDAPLLPSQLERLAKRAALGVGRVGGLGENSSGDLMLAFSTANPNAATSGPVAKIDMLSNDSLDPLFGAAADATEEAIVNAMIAAETMTGADNITVPALPHDKLIEILKKYERQQIPGSSPASK